uniref:Uncharacterized protein n=1 Tax=Helianthus annuus TaxID=4232 RepID=A0A251T5S3_HELAN
MNRAMSASSKSRLCSLFRSDALHKDPRGYIVRRFSLLVNDSGHESGDFLIVFLVNRNCYAFC